MNSPKEILFDIQQQNDLEARLARRNVLNSLKNRLSEWLSEFDSRDKGPAAKEVGRIADDLEGYLTQFRNT